MNNDLVQVFNNEEFGNVRVVIINNKEYFVANDIARGLGYSNPQKAIRDHCRGVNETELPTNGGKQIMKVIPEGDIYRLIIRSQLPSAEKFEKWVFDEVLPSIRNVGSFDSIENNIMKIEDEKERELTLKTYHAENMVRANLTDYFALATYQNAKQELVNYKTQREMELQNEKLELVDTKVDEIKNITSQVANKMDNLTKVGDRVEFRNAIISLARKISVKPDVVYRLVYSKITDLYGIDLYARTSNRRKKIQEERTVKTGRPYAQSTLESKVTNLDIIEELNIWKEVNIALNAVEMEYLNDEF